MPTAHYPFLPAQAPPAVQPLARYLPPLPDGMARLWLEQNLQPGSWVLDPFGSSPALALEMARAGCRVLVAVNNPVLSLIFEVLAAAPKAADFQSALADLAAARRGDERLELYLESLYLTECAACGQLVPADAFLWHRQESYPFARIYRCEACGDSGEKPVTAEDHRRLDDLGSSSLHRARALGRITLEKDIVYTHAVEALESYLPRPLDFLLTLINKLDGISTTPERKRLMQALVLSACDEGNTLWPWPAGRSRPRQLTIPPQFKENNLWRSLEVAISEWTAQPEAVPLTHWPDIPPPAGGICLYPGRMKNLAPLLTDINPAAAVTVLPRPNQAFWTLSAVWTGWLWGRQAVLPLRSALERRRYDWHWHAAALASVLSAVPAVDRFFAIIPEAVSGFLTAALTAGRQAGLALESLALRPENALAQIHLKPQKPVNPRKRTVPQEMVRKSVEGLLYQRSEPAPYLFLHAAGLESTLDALQTSASGNLSDWSAQLHSSVEKSIMQGGFVVHCDTPLQMPEGGLWWLAQSAELTENPLADRVEMEIVRQLIQTTGLTLPELDRAICERFRGLLTPPESLVRACLESYGEPVQNRPGLWKLHQREQPAARQQNIEHTRKRLIDLAQRLEFTTAGENPIEWLAKSGQPAYRFYLFASSIVSRWVLSEPAAPGCKRLLVFPGSRSNLLTLKLERDPRLAQAAQDGNWQYLKFRRVKFLADHPQINREQLDDLLAQDPPLREDAQQMRMF